MNNGNLPDIYYSDENNSNIIYIDGILSDQIVKDEDDVLDALADIAPIYGITNPYEEYEVYQKDVQEEITYYGLQQYYNGIEVYGSDLIFLVKNNQVIGISGRYIVLDGIETLPSLDISNVLKILKNSIGGYAQLIPNGLKIYDNTLVWHVLVYDYPNDGNHINNCEYLINANNGEISHKINLVLNEESVESKGIGKDNQEKSFNTTKIEDDKYEMSDINRNITIHDANNRTLKITVLDKSGKEINFENYDNYDDLISDIEYYYLSLKPSIWDLTNATKIFKSIEIVSSNSNQWNNYAANSLAGNLKITYDFFNSKPIQRKSFDGHGSQIIGVVNDYILSKNGLPNLTNAYSSRLTFSEKGTILSFGTDNAIGLDSVAHEYMHSVESTITRMDYSGESGALMEAYSDIFGELVENKNSWVFENSRNLENPLTSGYPNYYKGENWKDAEDLNEDNGNVHNNSTVISHAAYLMKTKGFSNEDIARIWYNSLFSLSRYQEHNFMKCAYSVVMTAKNLGYTEEQINLIIECFNNVGIHIELKTTEGYVTGKIVDENDKAVNEAIITLYQSDKSKYAFKTTKDGIFNIAARAGAYEVVVSKPGYQQKKLAAEIKSNETIDFKNIAIKFIKTGIQGKIVDENAKPLSTVDISITDSSNQNVYSCKTDENGIYICPLENGNYKITATKYEYESYSKDEVTVFENVLTLDDIVLLRDLSYVKFAGGDGSKGNPYQVSTPEQLNAIRCHLNKHFVLVNNIDMSNKKNWKPIGGVDGFSGSLNGNNYQISNLKITGVGKPNSTSNTITYNTGNEAFGLFSVINSKSSIENLKISNIYIDIEGCYADVGIIAGISSGTIKNCSVNGYIMGVKGGTNDSNAADYMRTCHGGIVGRNHGYIQYCKATSSNSESWYGGVVGGIAGYNIGTVDSCETTNLNMYGDSPRNGVALAGGIVGRNTGEIKLCHSNATVYAYASYGGAAAGGIAGSNSNLISYCYFDGAVSAKAVTSTYGAMDGGIVGSNGDKWRIGYKGKINNCVYTTSQYVCRHNGGSSCLGIVESNYTTVEEGREIIDEIDNEIQKISN